MDSRVLVGTLATLNTFMAPLAGTHDPTAPTYKLVEPAPARACSPTLGLHIDSNFQNYVTVQVGGALCTPGSSAPPSRNIGFALRLPADLLDEEFLRRLPKNAAYVIAGLPVNVSEDSTLKTRVKITKLATDKNGVPLLIEWLPDDRGHVEHPPMRLWLKPSLAGNTGLPWEKISFSELAEELPQPLTLAGEMPAEKSRPSKLR